MKQAPLEDVGRLVLRLAIGGLMLLHGIAKLSHGVAGIAGMLAAHGLPRFFAYGTLIGEVVAPLCLIIGFDVRPAAAIVAFNMLVAVFLAHAHAVGHLDRTGGWSIELPALYFFGAVAIALLDGGRFALSRRR